MGKGGKLIGQGSYTCVYDPPIDCADGTPVPPGNVSRVVAENSDEPEIQQRVKDALTKLDAKYQKNFNFLDSICEASFKQEDLEPECKVKDIKDKVLPGSTKLKNLITSKQDFDLVDKEGDFIKNIDVTSAGFKDLFHAVIEMNSLKVQVFHRDTHSGNIAWKGDNIVLHDWGLAKIGDNELLDGLSGRSPGSYQIIGPGGRDREFLKDYNQWHYVLRAFAYYEMQRFVNLGSYSSLNLPNKVIFRFWDTFALIGGLNAAYMRATGMTPPFITKLQEKVFKLYVNTIDLLKRVDNTNRTKLKDLPENEKEHTDMLNNLTSSLHKITDMVFEVHALPVPTAGKKTKRGKRGGRRKTKKSNLSELV
jgi:hypothetical protein